MTTTNTLAAIRKSIHDQFVKIGTKNGARLPDDATANTDPIAHELFVAKELQRLANGRAKTAEAAASELMDDQEKLPEGLHIISSSAHYQIALTIGAGRASASGGPAGMKFDVKAFISQLKRLGVDTDIIDKATKEAATPAQGTKSWSAQPLTE